MDIKLEFGRRVRCLRDAARLSQAGLAARCGQTFDSQAISEIERGKRNCTLATIKKLASGLKCEPAQLLLLDPEIVRDELSLLDERLVDMWNRASDEIKRKAIYILAQLF